MDDLSSLENPTEDTQKAPEENEPSRWLSRWSHVFAGLAFCLLYFPFQSYSWSLYVAVAGSYSVFAFAIGLGLGLDSADDFLGDPRVPKFIATLLLPHALILAFITLATYLWLSIGATLPSWATQGRRLPLWITCGVVVLYFAGRREGLWMAGKIKGKFKEPEDCC